MNKATLHSLDQLLTYLNQNPKTKGIEFERSCKWFLENDPEYKQKLQKVWFWSDWPGSKGKRDTGIDLIAQDIENKIWAIQVKAYGENNSVTKAGIDSFLSASSRSDISFRLLIATTNEIGSNGQNTLDIQEKSISLCLRDKLEQSPVDWMLSLTDTKFIQKNIKKPREHQQQALDAITKGFEFLPAKGQLHMACGTGKSLIGLWLAQKLQAQYTLVLVPSISLVGQLRRTWAENSGDFIFDSIFVCSDHTVGYKHSDERQEAFEMGSPATTNAQELIQQLLSNSRPKVIFSTYHSSMVIEEACKLKPDLMFDLVIADEAHRCVGKVKSDFAIITDDNKIKAHRKLYMTATPRIYTEHVKSKAQEYECEIASMDDEEKFGPVLYRLPFSDAIKQELLTDYQVVISVIDHDTYRDYAEKGKFINIDDYETDARKTATQLLIAQAIQKYGLKKIISFHNGVSVAQDFVHTIPKAIELLPQDERPQIDYYNVVHGEQSQSERYKILKNFNNPDFTGAVIIGNDRCLREGVDIPALDGIVFADPKNSEVDIIQGVGRAIRLSGDKKIGTIIIPVFIDKQSQGIEDLENSCFKKVWQIIKALRTHDDVLAEELDNIRLELGKRSYKALAKLPSKIVTDIPVTLLDKHFACWIESKIIGDVIEKCTDDWNYQYQILQKFRHIYPHRWPKQHEEFPESNKLGGWCSDQRKYFHNNMSTYRKNLLTKINFPVDHNEYQWQMKFEHLQEFRKLNLDKWPHKKEEFPEGNKVGVWYGAQQNKFKNGRLKPWQIQKLKSIGFVGNVFDTKWAIEYANLQEFRKIHPNRWPLANEEFPQNNNLGNWLADQRANLKNAPLTNIRMQLLNQLGIQWDVLEDKWYEQFQNLKSFRVLYPDRWPMIKELFPGNNQLGMWCSMQRDFYKNDKLESARKNLLNSILFPWSLFDEKWNRQYVYLKAFHSINTSQWPKKGEKSYNWMIDQRKFFKNDLLSSDRIEKLNAINFPW